MFLRSILPVIALALLVTLAPGPALGVGTASASCDIELGDGCTSVGCVAAYGYNTVRGWSPLLQKLLPEAACTY